ncbi:hypothetical protein FGB62_8g124 [Gracilaria domingensis]|nr:hypothetical protein FGB62_8g124 [Gracilaria domingensis]
MYASRSYKSSYKSVISAKRPFGCEGRVGRAMSRFIIKLRIEAHHEMRLSIGARGGAGAFGTVETMVSLLSEMALNDFPRFRSEASGVLTRALRIVRPHIRKREVLSVIDRLRSAAFGSYNKESLKTKKSSEDTDTLIKTEDDMGDSGASNKTNPLWKDGEISYEQIIGSSSILRSSALAPMIMRDWSLFSLMIKTILFALSKAERADGADLETIPRHVLNASEQLDQQNRQKHYVDLSEHLLSLLTSLGLDVPELNGVTKTKGNGTHWKTEILITTVLYFLLRDDRPPSAAVADFFTRSIVSDIMALRHVSSRAVFLMLALSEKMAKRDGKNDRRSSLGLIDWSSSGDSALMTVSSLIGSKEYVRKLIHTLALHHDDASDGGLRRIDLAVMGGLGLTFLSRTNDGECCWIVYGGRQWPTSWHPRSKDTLNLVSVRYYEAFARIWGKSCYEAAHPTLTELVETIKLKRECIIEGVKDEDVKVVAGEVLAG